MHCSILNSLISWSCTQTKAGTLNERTSKATTKQSKAKGYKSTNQNLRLEVLHAEREGLGSVACATHQINSKAQLRLRTS